MPTQAVGKVGFQEGPWAACWACPRCHSSACKRGPSRPSAGQAVSREARAASSSSSRPRSMSLVEREAPPKRKSSARAPSTPSDPAPPGRGVAGTVRKRLACEVARGWIRFSRPQPSSAAPAPCETRRRSRISRGHRRKGAAQCVGATAPSCLLFEFPRREQPAAKCLPHSHFQLLGLNFPGYVDERSRRGG